MLYSPVYENVIAQFTAEIHRVTNEHYMPLREIQTVPATTGQYEITDAVLVKVFIDGQDNDVNYLVHVLFHCLGKLKQKVSLWEQNFINNYLQFEVFC